ncbi:MAG: NAD(P)-dependent oxidoreductase [Cyanobacteria bacterium J06607_17]
MKKNALVTGASGSIGRYVTLALADQGWTVTGLGHGQWSKAEQARYGLADWHAGDVSLKNLQSLSICPDWVIHCAGGASVGASVQAPHQDFDRTVTSTAAILAYMRAHCPDAILVYPSSAAVYGIADNFPIQENSHPRPASPYGVHKKLAEDIIAEYSKLFGLKSVLVRLFSVYGEGFRKQLLWEACRRIQANETAFFGTGDETRDWIHVSDAASLLTTAAEYAEVSCPVVNGAFGEAVSVREILSELFRLMNRSDQPQFSGSVRAGDPLHYHASIERAKAWGWQPKVHWKYGCERYVSWFCKETPA